jgi:hypothetical protein
MSAAKHRRQVILALMSSVFKPICMSLLGGGLARTFRDREEHRAKTVARRVDTTPDDNLA